MSSSNSIEVPQESTDFLVALMFDLALLDDPDLGKGKSPPSLLDDFHFAVRLQDEEEKMLLKDLQMARSISGACAADGTEIETIVAKERQDEADRRLALALSSGQSLDRSDSRASTVSSSEGYGPALLRSTTSSSSSFATLVDSSSPKAGPSNYGECASCYNETSLEPLPCKHKYCRPCIIGIVRTAAQDMSLIPARCCGKPFPDFLLAEICKSEPSVLRAYNAMKAHRQEVLKEAERSVDAETGEMFQRAGLKRCPGCQLFVQKAFGCNHMTCIVCHRQFCWLCFATWKTCSCDLYNTNEIEAVLDERHVPQAPREQVRVAMHDIQHRHVWSIQWAPARCSICRWTSDRFHFVCAGCREVSCKRCRMNRV